MGRSFIKLFILYGRTVDLLRNIRTQVLIKLIRPYTRIAIPFISTELNIEPAEVESLLVSCILDKYVSEVFKIFSSLTVWTNTTNGQ